MLKFKTQTVEDTELIYSILREKYPNKQIEIEFNDNTKEYNLILTNKEFVEDPEVPLDVKIKVIYGDSVTGDTPLLLRKDNMIFIETIQSIFDENKKDEYPGFKIFDQTIRLEKEYSTSDYQIWSDKGWIDINKVIRHKCDKKIFNILTHCGFVKVTEDHSLLTNDLEIIKPSECSVDTQLMTYYPNQFDSNIESISKDRAFIYGFFYGDGSCDRYECPSGLKYSWALNNSDINLLEKLKNLLEKEYPNHKPVIYNTLKSSGVYKLSVNNQKDFIEEYRSIFYDSDRHKKVPTVILNGSIDLINSFFEGYWAADGCRKDKEKKGCTLPANANSGKGILPANANSGKGTRFDNKGQIGTAGLYFLMKKLGYNVSLNTRQDKNNLYRLTITKENQRKKENQIKKIEAINSQNSYVYDIETSLGRFQAGIGNIIVKNTDSVFLSMKFNRNNFELNRKDAFKLAIVCGDNLTKDIFKRPPIELEFEKVYQPFILLTKKRYIGKKFEDTRDPLKLKTITTAGIALTRRDYCQMVKKCYKDVIDKVMEGNQNSLEDSLDIFKDYIERIEKYDIDFDDLVVSAMLAKNYSCSLCKEKTEWSVLKCCKPNCKENNVTKRHEYCTKCKTKFKCLHVFSLAHVNLAVTLLKRTEEINVNDRIQYLYIEPNDNKKDTKKADLAEDPKYAKDNGLNFNRVCYLEQLAKPLLGFYKIVLKDNENLLDDIINIVNNKLVSFGGKKLKPSDFKIEDE